MSTPCPTVIAPADPNQHTKDFNSFVHLKQNIENYTVFLLHRDKKRKVKGRKIFRYIYI